MDEIVSQQPNLRLIVCPRPLSTMRDRVEVAIPAGATVAEHLRAVGCDLDRLTALVSIDGKLVPRAEWEYAVPQAEQFLTVQAIPAGGDDGGGKSILGIVAMIGLVVATWYIGGGGLAGLLPEALQMVGTVGGWQVVGAGVLLGGPVGINALILPSRDPLYRPAQLEPRHA